MAKNAFDKSARVGNEKVKEAAKNLFLVSAPLRGGAERTFLKLEKNIRKKYAH